MIADQDSRECEHAPGEHILISARKSEVKGRRRRGISIMQQVDEEGMVYAANHGCYHPFIAVDEDVSGDTPARKRPGLGPYLTNIEMRTWPVLVGATISRLGRNALDARATRDWAAEYGKKIVCLTPPLEWPTDDPTQKMMWGFLEQFAEMELDNIKLANRKARAKLRKSGAVRGRLCWGFQPVGDEGSKLPAVVEEKRQYLLGMVEMAEAGKTNREIAEWLDGQAATDENALPKYGGKWATNTIGEILRNELLYGAYHEGGKTINFTGVIDRDRFRELKWKLDNKPKSSRDERNNPPLMLSDVLYCAICDGIMHARRTEGWKRKDGTRTTYLYYRCDGKPRERSTCRNTIPAAEIEKLVNDRLVTLWGDETVKVVSWRPANDPAGEIEDKLAEIDRLDQSNRETFLPEYNRLMDEIEDLEREGVIPAGVETTDSKVKFGDHWRSLTPVEKHDYLVRAKVKIFAASVESQIEFLASLESEEEVRESGLTADGISWRIMGDPIKVIGELAKKVIPEDNE